MNKSNGDEKTVMVAGYDRLDGAYWLYILPLLGQIHGVRVRSDGTISGSVADLRAFWRLTEKKLPEVTGKCTVLLP